MTHCFSVVVVYNNNNNNNLFLSNYLHESTRSNWLCQLQVRLRQEKETPRALLAHNTLGGDVPSILYTVSRLLVSFVQLLQLLINDWNW